MKKIIVYISLHENNINSIIDECTIRGADEIMLVDIPKDQTERRKDLEKLQELSQYISIPFGVYISDGSMEDIKYTLYTGIDYCYVSKDLIDSETVSKAKKRFGEYKIREIYINNFDFKATDEDLLFVHHAQVSSIQGIKESIKAQGGEVYERKSNVQFSSFKTDGNGLVPVVVQDYVSKQVLMVAYMNEEAFTKTVETGRMTYFSRSRQSLWVKGETSGHYQFLKYLAIDCDSDTLLAEVKQVGAACHTGNQSCFYTNIVENEKKHKNSLTVLENLYNVIEERKANPKEGSYTNYLFEKGLDKILKKVGEESSEIIIAAKNEDGYEIKYEIADLLYHLSVLMVEQKVSWDDIMTELTARG